MNRQTEYSEWHVDSQYQQHLIHNDSSQPIHQSIESLKVHQINHFNLERLQTTKNN